MKTDLEIAGKELYKKIFGRDYWYLNSQESKKQLRDIIEALTTAQKAERVRYERLIKASKRLLERIDYNGGIGEYKGGPVFVVKEIREAIQELGDSD